MSDDEMIEHCYQAMERQTCKRSLYNPLRHDDQAMALVKKFDFVIERDPRRSEFFGVSIFKPAGWPGGSTLMHAVRHAPDLNRAICECVARLSVRSDAGAG